MGVLFVCTGNRCRSAVAERLTVSWASRLAPDVSGQIGLASAGTDATPGMVMDERSALALTELGGDPSGFVSRRLTPADGLSADLVLTMTRRQRRRVIEQSPRAMRRTFTLMEASALLAMADVDDITAAPPADRPRRLAGRLDEARAFRAGDASDDIVDPIGCPPDVHRAVAAQVAGSLRPIADVLFAAPRGDGQGSP